MNAVKSSIIEKRHPLVWVPSLYFAQGLPYAVVMVMSGIMYKRMGVSNEEIAFWTNLLGVAWAIKPFWSPLLELVGSKKSIVVVTQLCGGATLILCALILQTKGFFTFSIGVLAVSAFASATHDIASDGFYISSLSDKQKAMYAGWMGAFWNGGKLFVLGGLVVLAGSLENSLGVSTAWTAAMLIPGVVLIGLGIYHLWAMPRQNQVERTTIGGDVSSDASLDTDVNFLSDIKLERFPFIAAIYAVPIVKASLNWIYSVPSVRTSLDVVITFFKKPQILLAILFILLFRAGEGQVQTIGRLFLLDSKSLGGLGMTTEQVGIAYGTVGTLAFIVGSILGGYFAAAQGLKRAMFLMILAMNLPNLTFLYLNVVQPDDQNLIRVVLSLEMFGFGFGFPALMLYIMQVVAKGKYPTAHYAIGTGIMQLGVIFFGMMSGKIEKMLGYHDFFIWCVVSAIPVLVLSLIVKLPGKDDPSATATSSDADSDALVV